MPSYICAVVLCALIAIDQTLYWCLICPIMSAPPDVPLRRRLAESRDELDEFQENSRELEAELEAQLEQQEQRVKELTGRLARVQTENDQIKVGAYCAAAIICCLSSCVMCCYLSFQLDF